MTSAAPNSEFSHEFERDTIALLLRSEGLLAQLRPVLRAEHFTHPAHVDFVGIILNFYQHYQRRPNEDEFINQVALILEPMKEDKKEEYLRVLEDILTREPSFGDDYAADKATEFCRYRAMATAVLESADIVRKRGDYSQIGEKVSAALAVGSGDGQLDTVVLSEIEMKSVEWLWKDKFPKRKLSLLVGNTSAGKSYFTTMMMARVSQGKPWPTEPSFRVERGSVILLTAEDDLEDTVAPRIAYHKGDLSKVIAIQGTRVRGETKWFDLAADAKRLEEKIKEIGDVRLIIIDPVTSYVGPTVDTHRDRDVRGMLNPLVALAMRQDVAILGIVHLNKSQDLQAIYRVSGSMAFVAAARAVWLVAQDKADPELRHFAPMKCNLTARPVGFSFRIQDDQVVIDLQSSPPDVEELTDSRKPRPAKKIEEAKSFLREILKDGPMLAKEVTRAAKMEDITERTLKDAREQLRVRSAKGCGVNLGWSWYLAE